MQGTVQVLRQPRTRGPDGSTRGLGLERVTESVTLRRPGGGVRQRGIPAEHLTACGTREIVFGDAEALPKGVAMPPNIYIEAVHFKEFGCLKNVEFTLTPIHALIGPNDSGKSTILRAVRTVVQLASGQFRGPIQKSEGRSELVPFDPGLDETSNFMLMMRLGKNVKYSVFKEKDKPYREISKTRESIDWLGGRKDVARDWLRESRLPLQAIVSPEEVPHREELELKGSLLVRLDPDALKNPGPLITAQQLNEFFETKEAGIASILDFIRDRGDGGFERIVENVISLFPSVKYVGFHTTSSRYKELQVTLQDGTIVSSPHLSEGLLVYLAFASLEYLNPVSILLVEEPENGLHPARIGEVMRLLREISKTTQVLIATHSPLVVNELEGDEITVVTRDPSEGTKATRLSETPNYLERSKVYSNGELWVSYSNGEDEAPLLKGEQ